MASKRGTQLTVETHGKEGHKINILTSLSTNHHAIKTQLEAKGSSLMKSWHLILQGTKWGKVRYREQVGEQTEAIQLKASNQMLVFPFISFVTLDRYLF